MSFRTKTEVGSKIFALKKIKREPCSICDGTGKIRVCPASTFNPNTMNGAIEQVTKQIVESVLNDNVKEYECPECHGSGQIKFIKQKKYRIIEYTVDAIQMTIGGDKIPPVIIYFAKDENGSICKFLGEQFFVSREEAEKKCFILNLERKEIELDKIQVPYYFANKIPCNEKINKRLDEWRKSKRFNTEIYVDENYNLFDGYTSYLIYRMFGIDFVPVVVWPFKKIKEDLKNEISVS